MIFRRSWGTCEYFPSCSGLVIFRVILAETCDFFVRTASDLVKIFEENSGILDEEIFGVEKSTDYPEGRTCVGIDFSECDPGSSEFSRSFSST